MTVMKIRLADCVLCLFGCCDRVDSVIFTVAQDGSANFSKIVDALATALTFSQYVTTIIITRGTHHECIRVDSNKANILFVGDGIGRTIIAGNCSFEGGGYNIDRSATVGVEGDGFVAKYISFVNNAGIEPPSMRGYDLYRHQSIKNFADGAHLGLYNKSSARILVFTCPAVNESIQHIQGRKEKQK